MQMNLASRSPRPEYYIDDRLVLHERLSPWDFYVGKSLYRHIALERQRPDRIQRARDQLAKIKAHIDAKAAERLGDLRKQVQEEYSVYMHTLHRPNPTPIGGKYRAPTLSGRYVHPATVKRVWDALSDDAKYAPYQLAQDDVNLFAPTTTRKEYASKAKILNVEHMDAMYHLWRYKQTEDKAKPIVVAATVRIRTGSVVVDVTTLDRGAIQVALQRMFPNTTVVVNSIRPGSVIVDYEIRNNAGVEQAFVEKVEDMRNSPPRTLVDRVVSGMPIDDRNKIYGANGLVQPPTGTPSTPQSTPPLSLIGTYNTPPPPATDAKTKLALTKAKIDARKAKEDARKAKEDARKAKEEAKRVEEDARKAKEDTRKAKEDARKAKEEAKRVEEDARKAKEDAESKIKTLESQLQNAMNMSSPEDEVDTLKKELSINKATRKRTEKILNDLRNSVEDEVGMLQQKIKDNENEADRKRTEQLLNDLQRMNTNKNNINILPSKPPGMGLSDEDEKWLKEEKLEDVDGWYSNNKYWSKTFKEDMKVSEWIKEQSFEKMDPKIVKLVINASKEYKFITQEGKVVNGLILKDFLTEEIANNYRTIFYMDTFKDDANDAKGTYIPLKYVPLVQLAKAIVDLNTIEKTQPNEIFDEFKEKLEIFERNFEQIYEDIFMRVGDDNTTDVDNCISKISELYDKVMPTDEVKDLMGYLKVVSLGVKIQQIETICNLYKDFEDNVDKIYKLLSIENASEDTSDKIDTVKGIVGKLTMDFNPEKVKDIVERIKSVYAKLIELGEKHAEALQGDAKDTQSDIVNKRKSVKDVTVMKNDIERFLGIQRMEQTAEAALIKLIEDKYKELLENNNGGIFSRISNLFGGSKPVTGVAPLGFGSENKRLDAANSSPNVIKIRPSTPDEDPPVAPPGKASVATSGIPAPKQRRTPAPKRRSSANVLRQLISKELSKIGPNQKDGSEDEFSSEDERPSTPDEDLTPDGKVPSLRSFAQRFVGYDSDSD